MTSNEIVEISTPHVKRFLFGSLIVIALDGAIFLTQFFPSLQLPFILLIPLILIAGIAQMFVIYRQSQSELPLIPFTIGVIFIIGGAVFDMVVTVIVSSDLKLEANPIARLLLDSGYSIVLVYSYGLLAQFLLVALYCVMWASFLRHCDVITAPANSMSISFLDYFKATHGGDHLSWRQFMFPVKMSELPKIYYMIWFFVVVVVGGASQVRWYLGLEWLNVAVGYRTQIAIFSSVLFMVGYEVWLFICYQSAQRNISKIKTG
ncbi:MAG TPA: hypothetical protein PLT08_18810 [Anaerolineales bacterium]|nr:hypothetical protein [Anaerolineales bacterium]